MLTTIEGTAALVILTGLVSFCVNKAHLLISLLSLELTVTGLFWSLALMASPLGSDKVCSAYYLVVAVGESVLGLALLIAITFKASESDMKSMTSVTC